MVYPQLIRKELMENRWKFFISFGVLAAFGSTLYVTYEWLGDIFLSIAGLEGEAIRQLLGEMMGDYWLFAWANWYGKTFYQLLTLFAIIMGMSLIAGEVGGKTISFLLALPISRQKIYWSKYAAGLLIISTTIIGTTIITYLASQIYGQALPLKFLAGIPMVLAGSMVVYSIAVLCSVLFDDQVKAGVAAGLLAFLISLPGWVKSLQFLSIYVHMRGWAIFAGQGSWVLPFAIMLLASGAIAWGGARAFQNKDY